MSNEVVYLVFESCQKRVLGPSVFPSRVKVKFDLFCLLKHYLARALVVNFIWRT